MSLSSFRPACENASIRAGASMAAASRAASANSQNSDTGSAPIRPPSGARVAEHVRLTNGRAHGLLAIAGAARSLGSDSQPAHALGAANLLSIREGAGWTPRLGDGASGRYARRPRPRSKQQPNKRAGLPSPVRAQRRPCHEPHSN